MPREKPEKSTSSKGGGKYPTNRAMEYLVSEKFDSAEFFERFLNSKWARREGMTRTFNIPSGNRAKTL